MLMKKIRASKLTSLAALVAIALGSTAYATQYTVTPLGTLGGRQTQVNAISSTGELVGWSDNASGVQTAFSFNSGSLQSLGILSGYTSSVAYGVNQFGQIVGAENNSQGSQAFLDSNGSTSTLYLGPIDYGVAYDINSIGQIVGETSNMYGQSGFLYANGAMQKSLYLANNPAQAYGINDNGQIVGYAVDNSGTEDSFLYSNGTMTNLGTMGGTSSAANAINSSGQIVGWADNSAGNQYAFLYSNGAMTDIGTLGGTFSQANGINSSGQIVGWAANSAGSQDAFLYSNGVMQNLNSLIGSASSEYTLTDAQGINKNGQIAVNGTVTATGQSMGFLLTPVTSTSSAAVPAPETLGLLAAAMAGLLLMRRKQARSLS